MPTNTLTENACRIAAPAEKPRKLFDGHGLYLHITTSGHKGWRWAYRWQGKQQTATLGEYPLVTLADARKEHNKLRRLLAQGENPKQKKDAAAPSPYDRVTPHRVAEAPAVEAALAAPSSAEDEMMAHLRSALAILIDAVVRRSVDLLKDEVTRGTEAASARHSRPRQRAPRQGSAARRPPLR